MPGGSRRGVERGCVDGSQQKARGWGDGLERAAWKSSPWGDSKWGESLAEPRGTGWKVRESSTGGGSSPGSDFDVPIHCQERQVGRPHGCSSLQGTPSAITRDARSPQRIETMTWQSPTAPCHTRELGGIRTATGPTSTGSTGSPGTVRWVPLRCCEGRPRTWDPWPLALP